MEPELDQRIGKALAAFAEVTAAYLFGSTARGDADEGSDLDIAVLDSRVVRAPAWRRTARYADALQAALPGWRIDVVLLDAAPIQLADRILREGRLVLDRDPATRCDFEERCLLRYLDDLPAQRAWEQDFDAGMRERRRE